MPSPETGRVPAIVVDDVHVTYEVYVSGKRVPPRAGSRVRARGNIRQVDALRGVSLKVYEGDAIGVIGPNGSGKSTLMNALTEVAPVVKGAIYARSNPSLLGVGAAMLGALSGRKNVILGGLAMGYTVDEIHEKFDEIVEFSGITDFIDFPMSTYSAGMVERLKFAITATKKHDILIIDEALAVGDHEFRLKSEEKMRELIRDAGVLFLVSHSMKSILDICNRVIWIEDGQIVMEGEPETVCAAYSKKTGSPLDD
jgi:teichoic acid transport system ATP-binding protein